MLNGGEVGVVGVAVISDDMVENEFPRAKLEGRSALYMSSSGMLGAGDLGMIKEDSLRLRCLTVGLRARGEVGLRPWCFGECESAVTAECLCFRNFAGSGGRMTRGTFFGASLFLPVTIDSTAESRADCTQARNS
jgi:hypothetical protein